MYLRNSKATDIKEGLWWEETCVRRQGGYDLDTSNLPTGLRWFPKGAVLAFNETNGKAILVKTAKVHTAADSGATSLKVEDNGLFKAGDVVAGSTVSSVTVADGVATLKVSALGAAVKAGDVVADDNATKTLLGLNYATVDLRDNDFPSVTPTLQAFEIEADTLPYPVNDEIKEGLGALHQFKIQ